MQSSHRTVAGAAWHGLPKLAGRGDGRSQVRLEVRIPLSNRLEWVPSGAETVRPDLSPASVRLIEGVHPFSFTLK